MAKTKKAPAAKPVKQLPKRYSVGADPEQLDKTPIELPVNYRHPLSLEQMIAQALANEMTNKGDGSPETWEEANDFDVPDDEELDFTRYTLKEVDEVDPVLSQMDPETADAFKEFLKSREKPSEAPEATTHSSATPEPNGSSEAVGSS